MIKHEPGVNSKFQVRYQEKSQDIRQKQPNSEGSEDVFLHTLANQRHFTEACLWKHRSDDTSALVRTGEEEAEGVNRAEASQDEAEESGRREATMR